MTEKPKSVTVGEMPCPNCGDVTVLVKATKSGFLSYTCLAEADGGCQHQFFSRSAKSDRLVAGRIKKWRKPEYRAAYRGEAAPVTPDPDPVPAPDDAPEPDDRESRHDRELFG